MKYVAIIGKTGNGYAAHLPDLPGCIAAADTFEETKNLIEEAANFHVEGMLEDGETIPEPLNVAVEVEVDRPGPRPGAAGRRRERLMTQQDPPAGWARTTLKGELSGHCSILVSFPKDARKLEPQQRATSKLACGLQICRKAN